MPTPQVLTPQTPTPTAQMPTSPVATLQTPTPPMPMSPVLTPSMPMLANDDTSQHTGSGGSTTDISPVSGPPVTTWPSDTDIIFTPGTKKMMLTIQLPLMRSVMQDAFEHVRFYLLFNHVFPDAVAALAAVKAALASAASGSANPRAWGIYNRLQSDEEYASKMIRLVRSFLAFPFPCSGCCPRHGFFFCLLSNLADPVHSHALAFHL